MKSEKQNRGLRFVCPAGIALERLVIGVTGNPGAGKTSVRELFQRAGCPVIDADLLGHDLLEPNSPVYDRVTQTFGNSIMNDGGEICRKKLGEIVFRDPDQLRRLNEIVHPLLVDRIRERVEAFRRSERAGPLIVDAALIYEWGLETLCDIVVVVTAPRAIRQERFVRMRGGTPADFERIERAQIPESVKRKKADYVIVNEGDFSFLESQVSEFLNK